MMSARVHVLTVSSILMMLLGSGLSDYLKLAMDVRSEALKSGLEPMPDGSSLYRYQRDALISSVDSGPGRYQVELGRMLYFDPRLSSDGLKSCNSCHNLTTAGSSGIDPSNTDPKRLNAPTIYNVIFNQSLYYDGRINALDTSKNAQDGILVLAVLQAFHNQYEMNSNPDTVVSVVNSSPEYLSFFRKAYSTSKVDERLVAVSIASFVSTLNTPNRLDDFLNGNLKALSKDEVVGLGIFLDKGCASCHSGVNLGGSMQPLGPVHAYKYGDVDGFRGDASGLVKVPTLRNINSSSPYFHNGGFKNLDDAIVEMARIQLGIKLSRKEVGAIKLFFNALNGSYPSIVLPTITDTNVGVYQ